MNQINNNLDINVQSIYHGSIGGVQGDLNHHS